MAIANTSQGATSQSLGVFTAIMNIEYTTNVNLSSVFEKKCDILPQEYLLCPLALWMGYMGFY